MEYLVFKNFDDGEEIEDMAFDFDGTIDDPGFLNAAENTIGPIRYIDPWVCRDFLIVTDSKLIEYVIRAAS